MVEEDDPAWMEECEFCGETFDSAERLREHKAAEHEAAKDEEEMQEAAGRRHQEEEAN